MGVSKYRDDSGWVKALASIGKYVASKQALKQQLNVSSENSFATIEDADIDGLYEYKELANKYTKIIGNQPSWSKKGKQATKDYNDLMQAVELNKSTNETFALYENDIENFSIDHSKSHVGREDNIGDEIYFKRFTKSFTPEGVSLYFPELDINILAKDLPNFTKVSEGKDVTTSLKSIIKNRGEISKNKNGRFIGANVVKDLNENMQGWWNNKKQRDIQMFDTQHVYDGKSNYTFGDYIAKKHNYSEILDEAFDKNSSDFNQAEYDTTKDVMISMMNESNTTDYLKEEYLNFITEVARQDHQANDSIRFDKKTGKQIEAPGDVKVSYPWNNDSTFVHPETALAHRNAILTAGPNSSNIPWYTGGGYTYKAVLLPRKSEGGSLGEYGWEKYNGGVKEETFTVQEMLAEFGVSDLNMGRVIKYYGKEEEGLP